MYPVFFWCERGLVVGNFSSIYNRKNQNFAREKKSCTRESQKVPVKICENVLKFQIGLHKSALSGTIVMNTFVKVGIPGILPVKKKGREKNRVR